MATLPPIRLFLLLCLLAFSLVTHAQWQQVPIPLRVGFNDVVSCMGSAMAYRAFMPAPTAGITGSNNGRVFVSLSTLSTVPSTASNGITCSTAAKMKVPAGISCPAWATPRSAFRRRQQCVRRARQCGQLPYFHQSRDRYAASHHQFCPPCCIAGLAGRAGDGYAYGPELCHPTPWRHKRCCRSIDHRFALSGRFGQPAYPGGQQ